MNRFLITFLAVFMAVTLALLGYDYLIVQPREIDKTQKVEVQLNTAQIQAQDIAENLDATVQESVSNANERMNAQADELKQRTLATDALGRASMFKTALSEYFMSNGRWPKDGSEVGMSNPESYAGGAVNSISVHEKGVVVILLNDKIDSGAKIKLIPDANMQSYVITWNCSIEGSESLRNILPDCK